MEVHFPKLGHAVDAVGRWRAVDVELMLEAEAFERKERFISRTLSLFVVPLLACHARAHSSSTQAYQQHFDFLVSPTSASMEWIGGQEMKGMYLLAPNVVIRSKNNLETISS